MPISLRVFDMSVTGYSPICMSCFVFVHIHSSFYPKNTKYVTSLGTAVILFLGSCSADSQFSTPVIAFDPGF